MLLTHPRIYLDADGTATDALLIRNGRVVATGDAARDHREAGEPLVEPDAACVMPALADAHCHLWGVGLRAGAVDLSGTQSVEEVYQRLGKVDADASPSGWVLGHGWDEHGWPDGQRMHRERLDELFGGTPVCLHRVDRHAIATNSAALRRAGVGQGYSANQGGRVVRDDDGRMTGVLVDEAMRPVLDTVPEPTEAEDAQMLAEATARYHRLGIAQTHMALLEVERIAMLRRLHDAGQLGLRVYGIVDATDGRLDEVLEAGPRHDESGWLSVRAIKLFADGALGSRGALLADGYPDGSHGVTMIDPAELTERVCRYTAAGFQVATHAIGDLGASRVLDAYAEVPDRKRRELRLRLEHAQMLSKADCARMAQLGVIASIQPIHLRSDAAWADRLLDDDQLARLFPWSRLAGRVPLAAGSDYPIEDPNPWHGIATAMTRRAADGRVFRGEEALSRHRAIAAYTTGAAFAAHWEQRLGRLAAGYTADFVAIDVDPFHDSADAIWDTEVTGLWIGGERRE